MTILKREPAVIIGIVAAALLAALKSLADNGAVPAELFDAAVLATPIIVGIVIRFFVTPTATVAHIDPALLKPRN